jgi:hypothetical protein
MIVSMDKIKAWLTWQFVALIAIGAALFIVIALWAPTDVRHWILGSGGLLSTIIAYFLESPGSRSVRMNSTPPPPPPSYTPQPPVGGAVLLLLIFLAPFLVLNNGCGGASWQSEARTTLPLATAGLVAADGVAADIHCDATDVECNAHLTEVHDSLVAAEDLAISAGAALTASISAGAIDTWLSAAACLAAGVQRVIAALTAAGVHVPPLLTQGDAWLATGLGACPDSTGGRFALRMRR